MYRLNLFILNGSTVLTKESIFIAQRVKSNVIILGGVMASVLALYPRFMCSVPAEDSGFFKGNKNLQHAFLWRSSKAVGPMSSDFTAC
jgi:hypothetical protein